MRKLILAFLFLFIFQSLAYSQIFENEQETVIRDSSIILLKKYTKYADLTEDGKSISEKYINKFLPLFSNDAKLVNDLYGNKQFLSPQEFVSLIKQNYLGGIEVKGEIDSASFKDYKKLSNNSYSVQAVCKKFTIGLNNKNTIVRKDIDAIFTINFKFNNNAFSDFKIKKIISKEIILNRHSDKKMKGLYFGINANILASQLQTDNNIQYYTRDYKLSAALSIGVNTEYYLSSNYAIGIGVNYYRFNSNFDTKYNNESNSNLARTDIDGDNYFLYVNSDFTEKNTLKFISIPVKFKYRHKLYNEISLYASIGLSASYVLSSESKINGNSQHSGSYDQYNLIIDDAASYNFGEHNYNESYDLLISDIFFSGIFELGISIPVKESSYLNLSAILNHSFSDLKYNTSSYRDDYIYLHGEPKNMYLQSVGINLSYIFKIKQHDF